MMNHDNNSLIWKPPETILIHTGTLQEGALKSNYYRILFYCLLRLDKASKSVDSFKKD